MQVKVFPMRMQATNVSRGRTSPVASINPGGSRRQFARKSVPMLLSVLLLRVVYFGLVIGGCTFILLAFLVGGLTVFLLCGLRQATALA